MKKNRFITWLKRLSRPDVVPRLQTIFWKVFSKKRIEALSEDARKVGVNTIGIGLVGIVVDNASVPRLAALFVFVCGIIIWLFGLLNAGSESEDKE